MVNLLGFYLNQSWHGIKKSYMVIFSIGLALSMVWAVNFTIEGGLSETFPTQFTDAEDFIVQIPQNGKVSHEEISNEISTLNTTFGEIPVEEGGKGLNYSSYSFLDLKIDGGSFGGRPNATRLIDYYSTKYQTNVHFLVYEPSYYSSFRFQALFEIVEGDFPSSPNEILVPYIFKESFFYKLGDNFDMDFYIGDIHQNSIQYWPNNNTITYDIPGGDYQIFRLNGSTIAGFYTINCEEVEVFGIRYEDLSYSWTNIAPLFFSSDFTSQELDIHPVMDFYSQLTLNETFHEILIDNVWWSSLSSTNDITHFGFCVEIDPAYLIHD
ncbi:MAG: hypothetical protein ACTSVL_03900, partial [Promethearchaeota archaeon]